MRRTVTITFRPDPDVIALLEKAQRGTGGTMTRLVNKAVREHFSSLVGKRILALAEESR